MLGISLTDNKRSEPTARPGQTCLHSFVLRVRTVAALDRAGILTVGDVRSMSDRELLEVMNVGPKSVADLRLAMAERRTDEPLSCLVACRPLSGRDQAIVQMRAAGENLSAIARRFGICRSRVVQVLDLAATSSASRTFDSESR